MIKEILSTVFTQDGFVSNVKNACTSVINKNMYTVNITDIVFNVERVLDKIFPNIPVSTACTMSSAFDEPKIMYNVETRFIQNSVSRMTFYRNVPIWLNIDKVEQKQEHRVRDAIFLKTFNTPRCVSVLKAFIERICSKGQTNSFKLWSDEVWYFQNKGFPNLLFDKKIRSFENIFIPDEMELNIKTSIDGFVTRRDWYMDHNIPYHFGIMLHGEPGTGKSVLAQAIASYLKAKLTVIPGDFILDTPDIFARNIQRETISKDAYQVILIEDVDCGFDDEKKESRDEDSDSDKREYGLASVLNIIDGLAAPSNTVFVFTTNHLEKLDPAFIRPGRCDLLIEVGYVSNETFNKFCISHYGKEVPADFDVKDGMTFATLQVEIMRGKTFEELCEFARKEVE